MSITRIGVGVLVYNDKNEFLAGKRTVKCGYGCWAPPGGSLEYGESPEECAERELAEETGLKLLNPTIVAVTSTFFEEDHWISIWVTGTTVEIPQNLEPEKCAGWRWSTWDKFPEPLLFSVKALLKKYHPEQLMPQAKPTWVLNKKQQPTKSAE